MSVENGKEIVHNFTSAGAKANFELNCSKYHAAYILSSYKDFYLRKSYTYYYIHKHREQNIHCQIKMLKYWNQPEKKSKEIRRKTELKSMTSRINLSGSCKCCYWSFSFNGSFHFICIGIAMRTTEWTKRKIKWMKYRQKLMQIKNKNEKTFKEITLSLWTTVWL